MPKVPNRRHCHHLNVEEERRKFVAAVTECGYNGESFASYIADSVESNRRRNRGDRKTRWMLYCHWAHAMKDSEIGPEDCQFAWPKEALNFLRSIAPFDVKGEIKKDAFKVSMEQFCNIIGQKYGIQREDE